MPPTRTQGQGQGKVQKATQNSPEALNVARAGYVEPPPLEEEEGGHPDTSSFPRNRLGQVRHLVKNDPRSTDEEELLLTHLDGTPVQETPRTSPGPGEGDYLVVRHTVVNTPTGAYPRGQVIQESHLTAYKPDGKPGDIVRANVQRLLKLEAVRYATSQEAEAGFVQLPDTPEEEMMMVAEQQQQDMEQQALARDQENQELRERVKRLEREAAERDRQDEQARVQANKPSGSGGGSQVQGVGGEGAGGPGTGTGGPQT
jgi:hypothetical protein